MNLGFGEIVALSILALVVFGPERLPEAARNAGQMIGKLRREANNTLDEFRRSADLADLHALRDELRAMTADLRLRSPLTWPGSVTGFRSRTSGGALGTRLMDSPLHPTALEPSILRPDGAAPFDPDAT